MDSSDTGGEGKVLSSSHKHIRFIPFNSSLELAFHFCVLKKGDFHGGHKYILTFDEDPQNQNAMLKVYYADNTLGLQKHLSCRGPVHWASRWLQVSTQSHRVHCLKECELECCSLAREWTWKTANKRSADNTNNNLNLPLLERPVKNDLHGVMVVLYVRT